MIRAGENRVYLSYFLEAESTRDMVKKRIQDMTEQEETKTALIQVLRTHSTGNSVRTNQGWRP